MKQSVNLELCLPPDPWPPTEPQATNEKQTHKAPIFQFTGWGLTREDHQQHINIYIITYISKSPNTAALRSLSTQVATLPVL